MTKVSLDKSVKVIEKAYNELGLVAKMPDDHMFKVVAKVKDGYPDITQVSVIDERCMIFESACEYKPGNAKPGDISAKLSEVNESISVGFFSYDARGFLKFRTSCLVFKEGKTTEECMGYIKLCLQSQKQMLDELEKTMGSLSEDKAIANEGQSYVPKRDYVDCMIG